MVEINTESLIKEIESGVFLDNENDFFTLSQTNCQISENFS
jgi:hypothetical protein